MWWVALLALLLGAGLLALGLWHWSEGEHFYARAEAIEQQALQERKWIRDRLAALMGKEPEPNSVHLVKVSPELAAFLATPETAISSTVCDYNGRRQ